MRRAEDFDALLGGIARLLNDVHVSHSTLLPESSKGVNLYEELVLLLWNLISVNGPMQVRKGRGLGCRS